MLVENARRRDREEEEREAEENGAREERRQQRENEMNEISEKIDGLHLKFIMEKFTVVDIPLSLNEDSLSLHTAKPNIRVITNNVQRDDVAIFFCVTQTRTLGPCCREDEYRVEPQSYPKRN